MATVNELSLNSNQKRAVLDLVKKRIKRDYEGSEGLAKGVCSHIKEVIYDVYHVRLLIPEIRILFPKFTYENAKMVSDGQIYEYSEPAEYYAWWSFEPYDYKSRIKFINWLKKNL